MALKNTISLRNLKVLMISFVYGIFNYGAAYFSVLSKNKYQQLQTVVNNTARHFLGFLKQTKSLHIPQYKLMRYINIMSINNLHAFLKLSRLNKILHTGKPQLEFSRLVNALQYPKGYTRNKTISFNPFDKEIITDPALENTFPYNSYKLFNRLPKFIKCFIGTNKFKQLIKSFFTDRCQHRINSRLLCTNCGANIQIEDQTSWKIFQIEPIDDYIFALNPAVGQKDGLLRTMIDMNF